MPATTGAGAHALSPLYGGALHTQRKKKKERKSAHPTHHPTPCPHTGYNFQRSSPSAPFCPLHLTFRIARTGSPVHLPILPYLLCLLWCDSILDGLDSCGTDEPTSGQFPTLAHTHYPPCTPCPHSTFPHSPLPQPSPVAQRKKISASAAKEKKREAARMAYHGI